MPYSIMLRLCAKGYRYHRTIEDKDEAREYAKNLRKNGYYARVIEVSRSTVVRSLGYDYEIWVKPKGDREPLGNPCPKHVMRDIANRKKRGVWYYD